MKKIIKIKEKKLRKEIGLRTLIIKLKIIQYQMQKIMRKREI